MAIEEELDAQMDAFQAQSNESTAEEAEEALLQWANRYFPIALKSQDLAGQDTPAIRDTILKKIQASYATKAAVEDPEALPQLERYLMIVTLDKLWQNHLSEMDDLRQSVGLRGYGQKNPLQEYQSEAYEYFSQLIQRFRSELCVRLFRSSTSEQAFERVRSQFTQDFQAQGPSESSINQLDPNAAQAASAPIRTQPAERPRVLVKKVQPRVGRNDPCPCGSGKKYKQCCNK